VPGGKPKACPYHPDKNWSRRHATECLHIHRHLYMPITIDDPLSFMTNLLPIRKPCRKSDSISW
ncbi:uncharacterized protein EV154DRAFT_386320, partial [Mucor mucedo]|uniref:uncharacterized protein n=1 Tax=Mucor mucedo TaxID=29922 RepID=UPI00221EB2A8